MYLILQYFKFLVRSTNLHGIHSPFVYRITKECLHDGVAYKAYATLASFRQRLYKNRSMIAVKDFGAGSRVFKSDTRKVSKIAKTAGITHRRAKLLLRISKYFEPKNILELGTSLGMATAAMSLGNKFGEILTVEGCKATANVAREQFDHFQLNNIELINEEFEKAIASKTIRSREFGLIYIDGNHNKEATLQYFEALLPNTSNETVMIFDDIHWSKDMTEAWQQIKIHSRVTVTIDTFYWGLVFFRTEQEKEHFTIRM